MGNVYQTDSPRYNGDYGYFNCVAKETLAQAVSDEIVSLGRHGPLVISMSEAKEKGYVIEDGCLLRETDVKTGFAAMRPREPLRINGKDPLSLNDDCLWDACRSVPIMVMTK